MTNGSQRLTRTKHVEDLDIHAAAVRDVLSSLGSTASKELSMLEKDSTSAIVSFMMFLDVQSTR